MQFLHVRRSLCKIKEETIRGQVQHKRQLCSIKYQSLQTIRGKLNENFHKLSLSILPNEHQQTAQDLLKIQFSQQAKTDLQLSTIAVCKKLGLNSEDLAKRIASLAKDDEYIENVHFSAPGFVNMQLSMKGMKKQTKELLEYGQRLNADVPPSLIQYPFRIPVMNPKNVLVDYSSPNICKELHVGHLRSTNLGDCIVRVLEFAGHKVHRVSHVGDFGSPIAYALTAMLQENYQISDKMLSPSELTRFYLKGLELKKQNAEMDVEKNLIILQRFCADEEKFLKEASEEERKLANYYLKIRSSSLQHYELVYELLNSPGIQAFGESFYSPFLSDIVDELKQKNLAELSKGALIVKTKSETVVVQKSNGTHLYSTTDLAAIKYRLQKLKMDWIIYITDASQKNHFENIFQIAEKAGWLLRGDSKKNKHNVNSIAALHRVDHLSFGIVKDAKTQQKLSSREGRPYPLLHMIFSAIEYCKQGRHRDLGESGPEIVEIAPEILEEKERMFFEEQGKGENQYQTEFVTGETEIDQNESSKRLAVSAIRYFDLHHPRDYIYSLAEMMNMKGNTAVYILYAFTRIQQLQKKAQRKELEVNELVEWLSKPELLASYEPAERDLMYQISMFVDDFDYMLKDLNPHALCDYLFILSRKFHLFYESCPVIGHPQQEQRLVLCSLASLIFRTGFQLLGFKPVYRL
jgi:arginyl-tRNA synthetase